MFAILTLMEIELHIWKWPLCWTSGMCRRSGNDFRQSRENEKSRDFQRSAFPPCGGTAPLDIAGRPKP
jgi:hypothetical protein